MEAPWTIILLMYATPLLLVEAGYFNGGPGLNELAISSEIAPTRACSVIGNIDTLLQCFAGCMKKFRHFYMFGRNSATLTCFCCKDPPQLPLPGTVFNTYIAPPCPLSYSEYTYGYLNICLRFVSNLTTYPMASSVCQQDGGDLVRLDSQRKFDIFQEFVANSTNATVAVWVQGIWDNSTWFYHDGTPLEFTCMLGESNDTSEARMVAKSGNHSGCFGAQYGMLNMFVCEIYRVFSGF
ncbi:uncharacterized protein LOC128173079 [Crassostrea angulata]|uniref:uncharacterized protein LOC128173079 n=1 Tax=Magallana angulata TaxID=2784310 RepID=UPI0022B16AF2|nr:uncharacterized protein LOC128173079 [Crassostrea angulata]